MVDHEEPYIEFDAETPDYALAMHLEHEGFGYWVNVNEIVREVRRMGWIPDRTVGASDTRP